MGELLGGLPLGEYSAPALLALFCLLIITGGIPTRRELKDTQAQRDKALELADKWQGVAIEQGMTLNRLLDYAETANHALTEIQGVVRTSREQATP